MVLDCLSTKPLTQILKMQALGVGLVAPGVL